MSANLAGGAWVKLVAKKLKDDGDPAKIGDYTGEEVEFAFAQNANWTEDFNVQPLEVLGHLGPKELNSFGYSLSLTIDTLVAKDKTFFNKFIPNRSDVQADGHLPLWLISYKSTDTQAVIYAQFRGVVVSNIGQNIATNQYVTQNIQLMAIERLKAA